MDLPIACTLTEAELRQRRREVLDRLITATINTTELSNGYAYEFNSDEGTLAMLGRLIALEHECCRFLTFRLSLEEGKLTAILEVTGSPEAKVMIANLFGTA